MTVERYFDEWPEDSPISWWNEGRKKLNEIVRLVNRWTLNGQPRWRRDQVVRHIDMGLQTFAARDGGSGWAEALHEMKQYMEAQ